MSEKYRSKQTIFDWRARALSIAFALLLAIPAIGTFFADDKERSRWENRPLTELPSLAGLPYDQGFFQALDEYLNDHFGLALEMNRLYRRLLFHVFKDSPAPSVTIGKDGFVFLNSHNPRSAFGAFQSLCIHGASQARIESAQRSWGRVFDYFEDKIERVALLIPLSKPTLYADKLPVGVPRKYREACSQFRRKPNAPSELAAWGEANGHLVVYPADRFHAQRFDGNFYPKENFHFSAMSAHRFGRIALEALGIDPDAADDSSVMVETVTRDLHAMIGFERKIQVAHFPYTERQLHRQLFEPAFVKEFYARARDFGTVTSAAPLTERTALMISNSFGAFAVGHLAPGYRSITWININDLAKDETVGFFGKLVSRFDPDDLIFVLHDDSASTRSRLWVAALDRLDMQKK